MVSCPFSSQIALLSFVYRVFGVYFQVTETTSVGTKMRDRKMSSNEWKPRLRKTRIVSRYRGKGPRVGEKERVPVTRT